jgi:hypothetical protein
VGVVEDKAQAAHLGDEHRGRCWENGGARWSQFDGDRTPRRLYGHSKVGTHCPFGPVAWWARGGFAQRWAKPGKSFPIFQSISQLHSIDQS